MSPHDVFLNKFKYLSEVRRKRKLDLLHMKCMEYVKRSRYGDIPSQKWGI